MKTLMFATCAALALQLGCGGDGGGGGTTPTGGQGGGGGTPLGGQSGSSGPFTSGLDGSKRLGALTPQEQQAFCAAEEKFVKANPVVSMTACKLLALVGVLFSDPKTDTEARMLCQQGYDDCLAMPGMANCDSQPATCTATVAQAEACLSAIPAFLASSAAAIPACNTLKLSDLQNATGGTTTTMQPPACKTLSDLGCDSPSDM
jgi:hypothetical protein